MALNSEPAEPSCGPVISSRATANSIISAYLKERSPCYRRLSELRHQGWQNPSGDAFFKKQRANADHNNARTQRFFYRMMQNIAQEIQSSTGGLRVTHLKSSNPCILDFCMAPGGFLATALGVNRNSHAVAFTLPPKDGGHEVLLPANPAVSVKYLDITMLAADMGVTDIPAGHPDAGKFLPKHMEPGKTFDLIFCDGQVLRTHKRAAYREQREARRLILTQLALGLEHVSEYGSMVILLHKVEVLETVRLLNTFSKFSKIQLFKSERSHAKRSSFYLVATEIRPSHVEAIRAKEEWKRVWITATFGGDEELKEIFKKDEFAVHDLLQDFGQDLVRLGEPIWNVQADALQDAPWIRGKK